MAEQTPNPGSIAAIRAQLTGSQRALAKALGELADVRAELEQARAAFAQVSDLMVRSGEMQRKIDAERYVMQAEWTTYLKRQRETIRRLVVAARAAIRSLRTLAGTPARWQMALLALKVNMMLVKEQAEQTKGGE